jgi:hypothetical protein
MSSGTEYALDLAEEAKNDIRTILRKTGEEWLELYAEGELPGEWPWPPFQHQSAVTATPGRDRTARK